MKNYLSIQIKEQINNEKKIFKSFFRNVNQLTDDTFRKEISNEENKEEGKAELRFLTMYFF